MTSLSILGLKLKLDQPYSGFTQKLSFWKTFSNSYKSKFKMTMMPTKSQETICKQCKHRSVELLKKCLELLIT